ncbi:MAG: HAD family hydrolase [Pseudomonadota bacterium]
MNGTFMFGQDRFGAEQDFFSTYVSVGSSRLMPDVVRASVLACCAGFNRDYNDGRLVDAFPSLTESVRRYGEVLDPQDARDIEAVIAHHEVGHVPPWASDTLVNLSRTHSIGVVSNVWAPSSHWSAELVRSGVEGACTCMVFSSDLGSVKPSPRLFLEALRLLALQPSDVLFVGDSLERDIRPAKALGMGTAWIVGAGADPSADVRLASIAELETLMHRPVN